MGPRAIARLARLERMFGEGQRDDYYSWLQTLSDDQQRAFIGRVVSRLADEGLVLITASEFSQMARRQQEEFWQRTLLENRRKRVESIVQVVFKVWREPTWQEREWWKLTW